MTKCDKHRVALMPALVKNGCEGRASKHNLNNLEGGGLQNKKIGSRPEKTKGC
jgi:hypothetical protein